MVPTLKNKTIVVTAGAGVCVVAAFSSSNSTICPFRNLTGYYCPLCGISRAMLSLVQLNFSDALQYNWLVFPLAISLVLWLFFSKKYLYIKSFFKKMYSKSSFFQYFSWALLSFTLLFNWVLRNISSTGLDYFAKR